MPRTARSYATTTNSLVVAAAIAATTLLGPAGPAVAAAEQPTVIGMIANTTPPPAQWQVPQRWGDGDIVLRYATRKQIDVEFPDVPGLLTEKDVTLRRDGDADLAVGTYPIGDYGDLEIRDVAFGGPDEVTRFDAAFRLRGDSPADTYFGQVRFGQDESVVRFSGTHLRWPQTPVGGTRVWATQTVHNAGSVPSRLGQTALTGPDAGDFALADDGCSGSVLAAGATCTVRVGFSPAHGGPRSATMAVATDDGTIAADLAGQAPLGISRITVKGKNWIALGKTRTEADGPYALFNSRRGPHATGFTAQQTYVRDVAATSISIVAPRDDALTNGTFRVGEGPALTDFWVQRASRACNGTTGSMTVSGLAHGDRGSLDRARIAFTLDCGNDPYPDPVVGEVLWRYRADVSAPRGPSGVSVTAADAGARTVAWGKSRSADAVTTIVRLVEGDGTGADVLSGAAIGSGAAGSARLPVLRAGTRYTVFAWSVDAAGNVSAPIRRAVTG